MNPGEKLNTSQLLVIGDFVFPNMHAASVVRCLSALNGCSLDSLEH